MSLDTACVQHWMAMQQWKAQWSSGLTVPTSPFCFLSLADAEDKRDMLCNQAKVLGSRGLEAIILKYSMLKVPTDCLPYCMALNEGLCCLACTCSFWVINTWVLFAIEHKYACFGSKVQVLAQISDFVPYSLHLPCRTTMVVHGTKHSNWIAALQHQRRWTSLASCWSRCKHALAHSAEGVRCSAATPLISSSSCIFTTCVYNFCPMSTCCVPLAWPYLTFSFPLLDHHCCVQNISVMI
jgi:hypothetical protein